MGVYLTLCRDSLVPLFFPGSLDSSSSSGSGSGSGSGGGGVRLKDWKMKQLVMQEERMVVAGPSAYYFRAH